MARGLNIVAGALVLAVLAASGPVSARRAACLPGCTAGNASACCQSCVQEGCDGFADCKDLLREQFDECINACPTFAGRCTITRECVEDCRAERTFLLATKCVGELRRSIRTDCSETERKCRVSSRAATRACRACGGGASVTAPSPPRTLQAGEDPFGCQRRCIQGIVGDCYAECTDRCEGDETALRLCRRGCRDAHCEQVERACTQTSEDDDDDGDGGSAAPYLLCCTSHDSCLDELADAFACVQVTTTTVTTATTSASTSSTSATSTTSTTLL